MAYVLKTAWLLPRVKGAVLTEVSIGNIAIRDIFAKYVGGYILLTNSGITGVQKLDLQTLQSSELPFYNFTFNTWLGSLGNTALPTTPYVEDGTIATDNFVTQIDAAAMGLSFNLVHDTYAPDIVVDNAQKMSLYLTSTQQSLADLSDQFCCVVNGFLHRKEILSEGVRIKGGRKTFIQGGFENVTLLSFKNVGKVREIGFEDRMIAAAKDVAISKSVILELGVDLTGKSVLFSFCGVLFGEHNLVTVIDRGHGIIKFDLYGIDLLDFFQEVSKCIDISSLDLNLPAPYSTSILKSSLSLERVVRAMFKLTQTFAIVVDVESLAFSKINGLSLGLYGHYQESINYRFPMMSAKGLIMPYRTMREGDVYLYTVWDDFYRLMINKRGLFDKVTQANGFVHHGDQLKANAYFLKITPNVT